MRKKHVDMHMCVREIIWLWGRYAGLKRNRNYLWGWGKFLWEWGGPSKTKTKTGGKKTPLKWMQTKCACVCTLWLNFAFLWNYTPVQMWPNRPTFKKKHAGISLDMVYINNADLSRWKERWCMRGKQKKKKKKVKGLKTGRLEERETRKSMGGGRLPEQMLQRSNVSLRL